MPVVIEVARFRSPSRPPRDWAQRPRHRPDREAEGGDPNAMAKKSRSPHCIIQNSVLYMFPRIERTTSPRDEGMRSRRLVGAGDGERKRRKIFIFSAVTH